MKKDNKGAAYMIKLTFILFLVSALTALLLGLVNHITEGKIQEHKNQAIKDAIAEVLDSSSSPEEIDANDAKYVTALYKLGSDGYAVEVVVPGSQGDVDIMVGITSDGAVSGVSIVDMSETAGLGDNAKKSEFRDQFKGATGSVAVTKDGGSIDALTGATVTSRAVCNGVNAALDCVANLG